MKNINEIRKALGSVVNAIFQIAEDKKVTGSDIGYVLKPATEIGPAIEDAGLSLSELGRSSNEDMTTSDRSFGDQLNAAPSPELARDIKSIEGGVVAIIRIVGRAKEEGIEEGRAQAFAEMGKIDPLKK